MLGKDYDGQDCAAARALETLGERWTMLIVRDALYGVRRFTDFQAHLDIPKAVLSDRLAGLVEDGVMTREPDPDRPGRHVYELTQAGRDLWPVVYQLLVWGGRHRSTTLRVFTHAPCDTPLDERGGCPKCGVVPLVQDVVSNPRDGKRDDPVAVALRRPHRMLDPIVT